MSLNFYFLPRCLPSFLSPNCYLIADIVVESFLELFRKVSHKHLGEFNALFPELCVPVAPEQRLAELSADFRGALIAKGAFNLNWFC